MRPFKGFLPIPLLLAIQLCHAQLGYDEPCSLEPGAVLCSPLRGFTCTDLNNGTAVCRCMNESEMEYQRGRDSCAAILHSKCFFEDPGSGWEVQLPCSDEHANCPVGASRVATCVCRHGYLAEEEAVVTPGNRCLPLPQRRSGQPCTSTLPCHPKSRSECIHGTCDCPHPFIQTVMDIEGGLSKCLNIPEFGECEDSPDCIANAECGPDMKCRCKDGHTPTSIPSSPTVVTCSADYEEECDGNLEDYEFGQYNYTTCNENAGLSCIEKKCGCRYEPDTVYDPAKKACASTVGNPCRIAMTDFYDQTFPECQSGLWCGQSIPWLEEGRGICNGS